MSQVQFNAQLASKSASQLPPARATTPEELNVVVLWNTPSRSDKAPIGTACIQTPVGGFQMSIFERDGEITVSAARNYLAAVIDADLRSAITEKVKEIKAREDASAIQVCGLTWSDFPNPVGRQKGYLGVELAQADGQHIGKILSLRFGVSGRGEAYLMNSEIFVKPEKPEDAVVETLSDGQYLRGVYKFNMVDGVPQVTKSDVRTGACWLNRTLYQYLLNEVKAHLVQKGHIAAATVVQQTVETPEGEKEFVASV